MVCSLPDYFKATNLAYEVLIKNNQSQLPIKVLPIIGKYSNISTRTFSQLAAQTNVTFDDFILNSPSDYGFTLKKGDRYIIVYNDLLPFEVMRFTLAHEFAHCILNHSQDSLLEQKEANCFARNLLCPHPIRSRLMLNSDDDYAKTFTVSKEMASVTINLNEQDKYHTSRSVANIITSNFFTKFKTSGMVVACMIFL